ncbi:ribosomal protection-like ABC-F family protein [Gorillibacterium massiliense]|uniref:ribosomal protection-like ABC-F family protein n=1 Tax=Gorillibacterium massiliense TaxID=1280390 RepID=UPI0004B92511|nr:ABC-F family ATP-binding cassette domain-containing protein [Gorillibacterium massiliense]
MIALSCDHIQKYFGAQLVLKDVTLELHEGDRAGLIGQNGSGKSTLLQLISGAFPPDEGRLAIRKGTQIGYLAQSQPKSAAQTVYDVLASGLQDVIACQKRMIELEAQMQDPNVLEDALRLEVLLSQYAVLQDSFEQNGGYEIDARIRQVTNGLGIPEDRYERLYDSLSGGEKTKVSLSALLIESPSLLLLDEPTNHLDLAGVEWLEGFLSTYKGTCLIVSHDRYFLDRTVNKMIELEDGECSLYLTHYSGYVKEKEERLLREFADYQEQQKKIRKMKEAIRQLQEWGGIGGDKRFFTRAASMQRALDRMEKLKRPDLERKTAGFDWQVAERSGRKTIIFEGVRKGYDERMILNGVEGTLEYGEKIALVGENGSGKTTLFKLLLGDITPDGGELKLGAQVDVGYLAQEEQPLDRKESTLAYFRREAGLEEGEARSRLARYLFCGQDVFKQVASLSGGEWTRLRLALLMERKPNLLLLDEPTNHLDVASREALEETLEEYAGSILTISHDRYFINKLAGKVWELRDGRIAVFYGNFDDYKNKREASAADETQRSDKQMGSIQRESRTRIDPRRRESQEERKSSVERDIRLAEQNLADIITLLNEPGLATDSDKLAQAWRDREDVQGKLDRLYEEWMALAELEDE